MTDSLQQSSNSTYLGAVEDHGALRVSGGRGLGGHFYLRGNKYGFLLPPEVVLAEDKVGQVARQTGGLEDFHLRKTHTHLLRNMHTGRTLISNRSLT